MTCKLEFTGHSDDIISVKRIRHSSNASRHGDDLHEDEDELSAYGGDNVVCAQVKVSSLGGARVCIVNAIYDGTWSFSVAMLEEERNIPPWKYTIDQPHHKYSTRLTIEADDDLLYEKVKEE